MTITAKALADLDSDTVVNFIDVFSQQVQEESPATQANRGIFRSTIGYFHALGAAQLDDLVKQYRAGRSVQALLADPASADAELADDVLSNFGVTRLSGQKAVGQVAVVLSSNTTVVVGQGAQLTANGLVYTATETFTAKAEATFVTSSADRLITALADGTYMFLVDVVAEATGAKYTLGKGTPVQFASPPPGYLSSYAYTDFSAGQDTETNAELIARLPTGLSARTLSTRVGMSALLRTVPAFSRILRDSAIGMGQAEMRRNRHNVFGAALGGYTDWYVRTVAKVQTTTVTKAAICQTATLDGHPVYQMTLTRNECQAFYQVKSVYPTGIPAQAGTIISDTRGFDVSSDRSPDIATAEEAAYSAYQTAVILFADTSASSSNVTPGSSKTFDIDLLMLPLIRDLQDYVNSYDTGTIATECLIKAPVPCFVTVALGISKTAGTTALDLVAIKEAVAASVNGVGWTGRVFGAEIAGAVKAVLPAGAVVSRIEMVGAIRQPSGVITSIRGENKLQLVENAVAGVSNKTVQFFCDTSSVGVTVLTDIPE